ncbi:MAG: helix-turn-helix domain-containing protein [Deltaproteobacteria bacterium]|nr:helix-turn-helix domain-containing protein [Deltaproteobacteria bacterium]
MTEEVASALKRAREEKGLSLKEAESRARIPAHYLQILEGEGDPRLLADALYLVPFLRTYSVFLGLDPAVTVAQFIAAMQKGETPGGPPPPKPSRFSSRTVVVLLILAGLAALSLLWITGEHG